MGSDDDGSVVFQAMETASEVRRARSGSVPRTWESRDNDQEVSISVNSAYVTNIALCPRTRTPPDLSPFMRRRLQLEAEERRLARQGRLEGPGRPVPGWWTLSTV